MGFDRVKGRREQATDEDPVVWASFVDEERSALTNRIEENYRLGQQQVREEVKDWIASFRSQVRSQRRMLQ